LHWRGGLLGAGAGAGAGWVIGSALGGLSGGACGTCICPGGGTAVGGASGAKAGGVVGAKIGALAGGIAGSIVGEYLWLKQLEGESGFSNWKEATAAVELNERLNARLSHDLIAQGYFCHLTHKPALNPVESMEGLILSHDMLTPHQNANHTVHIWEIGKHFEIAPVGHNPNLGRILQVNLDDLVYDFSSMDDDALDSIVPSLTVVKGERIHFAIVSSLLRILHEAIPPKRRRELSPELRAAYGMIHSALQHRQQCAYQAATAQIRLLTFSAPGLNKRETRQIQNKLIRELDEIRNTNKDIELTPYINLFRH